MDERRHQMADQQDSQISWTVIGAMVMHLFATDRTFVAHL
jgi:hypothetical protein